MTVKFNLLILKMKKKQVLQKEFHHLLLFFEGPTRSVIGEGFVTPRIEV